MQPGTAAVLLSGKPGNGPEQRLIMNLGITENKQCTQHQPEKASKALKVGRLRLGQTSSYMHVETRNGVFPGKGPRARVLL